MHKTITPIAIRSISVVIIVCLSAFETLKKRPSNRATWWLGSDTQATQSVNNVVCTRFDFCFVLLFFLLLFTKPSKCYRKTFKLLINRLKNSNDDDIKQTIINRASACLARIAMRYTMTLCILAYFSLLRSATTTTAAARSIQCGKYFEFQRKITWHLAFESCASRPLQI